MFTEEKSEVSGRKIPEVPGALIRLVSGADFVHDLQWRDSETRRSAAELSERIYCKGSSQTGSRQLLAMYDHSV